VKALIVAAFCAAAVLTVLAFGVAEPASAPVAASASPDWVCIGAMWPRYFPC